MRDLGRRKLGATPYDLRWPDTQEFTQVATKLAPNAINNMLDAVWQGYSSFKDEFLNCIDISKADEELERTITQTLQRHIRNGLSGDESYDVQHGTYEPETRSPPPAQPPEYDIAFILKSNARIMWPLEAKIMRSPANVAPYVNDINNEFLTGRYAPFSHSAAMLGYLLSGNAEEAPPHIEKRLEATLKPHPVFHPHHSHHISNHQRNLSDKSWASGAFTCHHMIMPLNVSIPLNA